MLLRLFIVICLFVAAGGSKGQAQFFPSELHAVWPTAVQAGQSTTMTVSTGVRLDEATSLIFSHPGITARVQTQELPFQDSPAPKYGTFDVQVADDVPDGYYDVRVVGRHGVSNPRRLQVSSKAVITVPTPSHERTSATECKTTELIAARATPAAIDYFAFDHDGKDDLSIQLRTQSIDSRCIGIVQLLDAEGKILREAVGGDGYDPLLESGPLPAGRYFVSVRDFLYRGGPEFHYLLDFPKQNPETWQDAASLAPGQATRGSIGGLDLNAPQPTQDVTPIAIPHSGCWWFSDDGTTQSFEFNGTKGQAIEIEIVSERLGEPTDARFQLFRVQTSDSGETLTPISGVIEDSQAINDGTIDLRSNDPVTVLTLPEIATYRLKVRDLDVGKSVRGKQRFVLRVQAPNPRYSLLAYRPYPTNNPATSRPFASKIARGGAESIRVFAVRQGGFAGEIRVTANHLADGLTCSEAVIAANQNHVTMTIQSDESEGSTPNAITVSGRHGAESPAVEAAVATIVHAKGAGRDFIQSRLADTLVAARVGDDTSPLSVSFAESNAFSVKAGEGAKLTVNLVRRAGGESPVVLRSKNMPPGMTAADVTISADQSMGVIDLKVGSNVPPGVYTIWLQAESKVKLKPNPQAFERAQKRVEQLKALRDGGELAPERAEQLKSVLAQAEKQLEAQKPNNQDTEQTVQIPSSIATIQVVKP